MKSFKFIIISIFLFGISLSSCKKNESSKDDNNSSAIGMIIDHNCTDLSKIPENAIADAKSKLHIAYGHTSHGSQLITGMSALVGQTDLTGYKGDIYKWNEGGKDGALDIDDYFPGSGRLDLGHKGDLKWEEATREYLAKSENSDVNVIIWSWCNGAADNTEAGIKTYLDAMNQLETDFPDVKFVYMTGHANIGADENLKARNKQIKDYCIDNNKILYDFFDIESYNPDGTYFEFVDDACNYYNSTGNKQGNWATEWRASHTEGTDWYNCSASHSDALNGNLKAYAAWWLWARLGGWSGK